MQSDACVEVDNNAYSVPWRLIGAWVSVQVTDGLVRAFHAGSELARHLERRGQHERVVDAAHLAGIVARLPNRPPLVPPGVPTPQALLRPLAEYERVARGGW